MSRDFVNNSHQGRKSLLKQHWHRDLPKSAESKRKNVSNWAVVSLASADMLERKLENEAKTVERNEELKTEGKYRLTSMNSFSFTEHFLVSNGIKYFSTTFQMENRRFPALEIVALYVFIACSVFLVQFCFSKENRFVITAM